MLESKFFESVNAYRQMSSLIQRTTAAKEIYSTFIQTDAPQEINIDHDVKLSISKGVGLAPIDLFDKAFDEIVSLLVLDIVPKFNRQYVRREG